MNFLWYRINWAILIIFISHLIIFFWSFFCFNRSLLHHCHKRQYANEIFAKFEKVTYHVILILNYKTTLFRGLGSPLGASAIYSRCNQPTGGLTDLLGASPTYKGPNWPTGGRTDLQGALPTYWRPHQASGASPSHLGPHQPTWGLPTY